jgi:L-asparaginase
MIKRRVHLLATGGTIATVYRPDLQGLAAGLSGQELMVEPPPGVDVTVEDFSRVNSTYITPRDMLGLSRRIRAILTAKEADGIVVTHGTSTMEETAFFLDITVPNPIPVVLTGAQRAAAEPFPDGPANLSAALEAASSPLSRGRGTLLVFAGEIHAARSVRKEHTSNLKAFSSGDAGLLGQVDPGGVVYFRDIEETRKLSVEAIEENVDLVSFASGMDARYIETSIARKAAGLVVEGVGMGNVNEAFYRGIKAAREHGMVVVVVSRSPNGRVLPRYGYAGGGASLAREGVIFGGRLSAAKARLLLMIGLGAGLKEPELAELFAQY